MIRLQHSVSQNSGIRVFFMLFYILNAAFVYPISLTLFLSALILLWMTKAMNVPIQQIYKNYNHICL